MDWALHTIIILSSEYRVKIKEYAKQHLNIISDDEADVATDVIVHLINREFGPQ